MNLLQKIAAQQVEKLKQNAKLEEFDIGDTVRVNVKIIEGTRERIQAYEGIWIAKKNAGLNSAFTVRKISYGEGVERVFPLYSPRFDGRARAPRQCPPVQALLSAQPARQSCPRRGTHRL